MDVETDLNLDRYICIYTARVASVLEHLDGVVCGA